MKKRLYLTLKLLLALAVLVGGGVILRNRLDYQKSAAAYKEAAEVAGLPAELPMAAEPSHTEEEDPWAAALLHTDLAALRDVNSDVTGWILIPGTAVSYPILQAADNQYYLRRTWQKERNSAGAIMLECTNSPDLSDFNSILYGHNMRSGAMFACLSDFQKDGYWQAHPSVYLADENGVYRYDVFAAYEVGLREIVYRLDIESAGLREEFIRFAAEHSVIDTGIVPTAEDRVLTLSTCTEVVANRRWVVQAVLRETFPAAQAV